MVVILAAAFPAAECAVTPDDGGIGLTLHLTSELGLDATIIDPEYGPLHDRLVGLLLIHDVPPDPARSRPRPSGHWVVELAQRTWD